MATATYEIISSTTLGTATSSVTLSSIPATYTDLVIQFTFVQSNNGGNGLRFKFNNDTGTNYSGVYLGGYGAVYSGGSNSATFAAANVLGSAAIDAWTNAKIDLFSYSDTATYKTALITTGGGNLGGGAIEQDCVLWRSTSAINSIVITQADAYNFAAYTNITVYGLLKA